MLWRVTKRACPKGRLLADRHYNRQKPGSPQFVPPGRCVVLITEAADALWITSWPFARYVRHAWAGAWVCSAFRNESEHLSSLLITQAVAATRAVWPNVPTLGMVTFIDPSKVRRKRDPGRCYRKAGFVPARCPIHPDREKDCCACRGLTKDGLVALQLLPVMMPEAFAAAGSQGRLFEELAEV